MGGGREKVDPAIERVVEMAALRAKVDHANQQSQSVINTLVKYSQALGRMLQCGRQAVDRFDELNEQHGACPDEALAAHMKELKQAVYDFLPKDAEDKDGERKQEPEASGAGEQGRGPDGGLDAPADGEESEGDAPAVEAETPGEAPPEETAPSKGQA